jgi:predicted nucleic acid-binding protein
VTRAVKTIIEKETGPLYLPTILVAEIDYLVSTRLGADAELDFLDSLIEGAFTLIGPTTQDLTRCRELVVQYRDLRLGIADASVVATAERLALARILTVDQRHFRAVQPKNLPFLVLLPADQT